MHFNFETNWIYFLGQIAAKIAKIVPDNEKVLAFFSTGLWHAVKKKSRENVLKMISNWVKIDDSREGKTLMEHAIEKDCEDIQKALIHRASTVQLAHYCLAGDRKGMRPLLLRKDININTLSTSFIDSDTGDFVTCPLIGEAALLGLNSVVRKLLRKKASINVSVNNIPLYLYILQNLAPDHTSNELLENLLFKVEFHNKPDEEIEAVLDAAYEKKLPLSLLRLMAANGLDIFHIDCEGHSLRDRILIKNATENPRVMTKEMAYVDQIVVDIAENCGIEMLKRLVLFGGNVFVYSLIRAFMRLTFCS